MFYVSIYKHIHLFSRARNGLKMMGFGIKSSSRTSWLDLVRVGGTPPPMLYVVGQHGVKSDTSR